MNADPHIDDERFKALLERWTDGHFTRSDEQALKTLTDPDDFRREAMEGYAAVPDVDHAERLQRMRAKLRGEEGQSSGGGRVFTLPRLMAAAAALALLIGAFWFFPTIGPKKEDAPLAKNEMAPVEPPLQPESMPQKGIPASPSTAETVIPEGVVSGKSAHQRTRNPLTTATPANKVATDDIDINSEAEISAAHEEEATPEKADPVLFTEGQAAQDLATSKPEAPGAAPRREAPAAESKDFVLLREDAKKAKTKPSAKKDSAWHDTESRGKVDALKEQVRAESTSPAYSEPVDGWDAFSEYLRQFARLTPDARNNNVSGKVRLQFTVGEDGTPYSFLVVRGLGHGCDEEAIRLVKGWEWVRGKNPLTTVEVPFIR